MTTKQKFEVDDPEVIVLQNGRYAYRVICPWKGKNEKDFENNMFFPNRPSSPTVLPLRLGIPARARHQLSVSMATVHANQSVRTCDLTI